MWPELTPSGKAHSTLKLITSLPSERPDLWPSSPPASPHCSYWWTLGCVQRLLDNHEISIKSSPRARCPWFYLSLGSPWYPISWFPLITHTWVKNVGIWPSFCHPGPTFCMWSPIQLINRQAGLVQLNLWSFGFFSIWGLPLCKHGLFTEHLPIWLPVVIWLLESYLPQRRPSFLHFKME